MRVKPGWHYRIAALGEVTLLEPSTGKGVPGGDLDLPYWRVQTKDGEELVVQEADLQVLPDADADEGRGPVACVACGGTGKSTAPSNPGRPCLSCDGEGTTYPSD